MLCTSVLIDDVMFSHGANTDSGHWQIIYHDSPDGTGGKVCSQRLPCLM